MYFTGSHEICGSANHVVVERVKPGSHRKIVKDYMLKTG